MEGGEKRERVGKKSMQMETERKPGVVISEDYRSETSGVVFRSEPSEAGLVRCLSAVTCTHHTYIQALLLGSRLTVVGHI